ncbi:TSUP family transporter [Adhaeribacter swui]|uniref:Probable membrane transporter protein n=1 Tax=Adhaeribacter swui TaxID=2086471 RepID=A0A7G7G6J9_9BACT|nr:TSUP family transporter [Adhaeribacter swui]QNF32783.1 TSUP family transporter [Adhaeribacter swui]
MLTEPKTLTATNQENYLFPVFLKLHELHTLIVGGGLVGEEKITAVLRNSPEARVTLVATQILPQIREFVASYPQVTLIERPYAATDLEEKDLVIVATDDKALNRQIKQQAKAQKLLANVADTPDECDFYLSSIVQKGNLKIAISTNGKSPTVAKRVKEVLNDTFPNELEAVLDNLQQIRNSLKGDFAEKVKQLNTITAVLVDKPVTPTITEAPKPAPVPLVQHIKHSWRYRVIIAFSCLGLMISGHLLFSFLPLDTIGGYALQLADDIDSQILWFMLAGFVAQMIDGALGMAYGVSASTFLLTVGIPPAVASASVHASEIFTSGVSGLMHLRFRNVNSKLFKNLLLPGVLGAILGAYILSSAEDYLYIIKPLVACYTLFLGGVIIKKAIKKTTKRKPVRKLGILATFGGFLDSVGGGGWGPIVSSSLIASGRSPLYTIGSVNLAEFFVSLASSITFITLLGFNHWQVVAGLVLGGVVAAPIAAVLARKLPIKAMMILVGLIVILVSLRNIITMIF